MTEILVTVFYICCCFCFVVIVVGVVLRGETGWAMNYVVLGYQGN